MGDFQPPSWLSPVILGLKHPKADVREVQFVTEAGIKPSCRPPGDRAIPR